MPYKPINEKTHSSKQKALPRMRTIPKAYKEIKELDANSDLTLCALHRMVNDGKISIVKVGTKRLINLDLLTLIY